MSNYGRPIRPIQDLNIPISLPFGAIREGLWATHNDHWGTDFAAPIKTPVLAVEDGTIYTTGEDIKGWGHFIILKAGNDYYIYGHLSKWAIKEGDNVKQGQIIGYSGNTGNCAGMLQGILNGTIVDRLVDGWMRKILLKTGLITDDGAHLHFERRYRGTTRDYVAACVFFNEKGEAYYA